MWRWEQRSSADRDSRGYLHADHHGNVRQRVPQNDPYINCELDHYACDKGTNANPIVSMGRFVLAAP